MGQFPPQLDMSMRTNLTTRALWCAFWDDTMRNEWWPELRVAKRVGGRIEATEVPYKRKKHRHASGRLLDVELGEHAQFEWRTKGRDATTTVDVYVSQSKKKSRIRIVESGFTKDDYAAIEIERMRDFWRDRLGDLQEWLEASGNAEHLESYAKRQAR